MRTVPRLVLVLAVAAVCAALAGQAAARPGAFAWTRTPDPGQGNDSLRLCAAGPSGSVYAAGSLGDYPDGDIWVVKYDATGAQVWSRTWAGPGGAYDEARGLVVDAAGDVYVCGQAGWEPDSGDSVLLKYGAAGTLAWATVYEAGEAADAAAAVGLDAAGAVYVAGQRSAGASTYELYTAKFRAGDGGREWTAWYAGGSATAGAIAVTPAGDCYVAGRSGGAPTAGDALLVKTSAAGEQAWARSWDGPAGRVDGWTCVQRAPGGGVVVAGTTDSTRRADFVAARYDDAGERAWLSTWSSPGRWYDELRDLAVAADGSVWAAGLTDRQEGDERGALVKWSAAGRQLFARSLGTPRIAVYLSAVTVDAKGDAYVVGSVTSLGSGWDLLAAKYAKAGGRLWYTSSRIGTDSQDGLEAVALGGPGYVYACGTAGWEGPHARGVVVKIRR